VLQSQGEGNRNKCIGSSKENPNFILREDLTMSGVAEMVDKTIVGKVYGRQFSEKTLKAWAKINWGASYNPPPIINRLSRGWFMIIFSEPLQAMVVLQKHWSIDSSLVLMKLWNPTFDAASERLGFHPNLGSIVGSPSSPLVRKMLPSNWEFSGGVFGRRYGIHRIGRDVGGKDSNLFKYPGRLAGIP
jgi:hypothetical protein